MCKVIRPNNAVWCSVRKLFNSTVSVFGYRYPGNSHHVAKWVISVMVHMVEKRVFGRKSGDIMVVFFDNTIGTVRGIKNAAPRLAELADRGELLLVHAEALSCTCRGLVLYMQRPCPVHAEALSCTCRGFVLFAGLIKPCFMQRLHSSTRSSGHRLRRNCLSIPSCNKCFLVSDITMNVELAMQLLFAGILTC